MAGIGLGYRGWRPLPVNSCAAVMQQYLMINFAEATCKYNLMSRDSTLRPAKGHNVIDHPILRAIYHTSVSPLWSQSLVSLVEL